MWEDDDDFAYTVNEPAAVNAAARERVEAEPERYVLVTEVDVGDPRELLREFLRSEWTTDAKKRERAWDAYSGAVGRWRREVGDETIVHAWHNFERQALRRRIVELLAEHGVEVVDVAKRVG